MSNRERLIGHQFEMIETKRKFTTRVSNSNQGRKKEGTSRTLWLSSPSYRQVEETLATNSSSFFTKFAEGEGAPRNKTLLVIHDRQKLSQKKDSKMNFKI